jgi:hypothetical protein
MDIYDSGAMPEREVSEYASSGAHWLPIARSAGEHHESGTDTGMTAIIVQTERLAIDLH